MKRTLILIVVLLLTGCAAKKNPKLVTGQPQRVEHKQKSPCEKEKFWWWPPSWMWC